MWYSIWKLHYISYVTGEIATVTVSLKSSENICWRDQTNFRWTGFSTTTVSSSISENIFGRRWLDIWRPATVNKFSIETLDLPRAYCFQVFYLCFVVRLIGWANSDHLEVTETRSYVIFSTNSDKSRGHSFYVLCRVNVGICYLLFEEVLVGANTSCYLARSTSKNFACANEFLFGGNQLSAWYLAENLFRNRLRRLASLCIYSNKHNSFPTKEAPIPSRAGHKKYDFLEHKSRNLYFIWTGVLLQSQVFE